jgi:hypothetical protein
MEERGKKKKKKCEKIKPADRAPFTQQSVMALQVLVDKGCMRYDRKKGATWVEGQGIFATQKGWWEGGGKLSSEKDHQSYSQFSECKPLIYFPDLTFVFQTVSRNTLAPRTKA